MSHTANETLRKSIHVAFGLCAFALLYLPWTLAAAVALLAIAGNLVLLHKIVGRSVSRHARGWDAGILLYPAAVLALILLFHDRIYIAAISWVILAFGDGVATMWGLRMPLAPLGWNRQKSWGGVAGFLLAGGAGAAAMVWWWDRSDYGAALLAVLAAAIVESLPLGVDDNITVPTTAAVVLVIAAIEPLQPFLILPSAYAWLVANTLLAIAGYILRSVDLSGALGGWLLGCVIILGGGASLYIALLAFFVIGTAATKLGFARKAARGLAQEKGGRRGFTHAFSNVGVAAICAIAASRTMRASGDLLPLWMGVASLATAAADTTASEIGQLIGRRAFLPLTLRRVEVGTEGAISLEGTLAGLIAAAIVASVSVFSPPRLVLLITLCAFLGSYLESIAGAWNRTRGSEIPNGVLNFFNTAVGALLFLVAWQIAT